MKKRFSKGRRKSNVEKKEVRPKRKYRIVKKKPKQSGKHQRDEGKK